MTVSPLHLLLDVEARRLADPFRQPRLGAWIGVGLPALLGIAALWLGAESVRPDLRDGDGAIALGLLVAAPIAFWAYPILFRPADDALLRRLGIPSRASYWLRAVRLAALALLIVLLLMIPYVATGTLGARPIAVAATAGFVAWGMALSSLTGAAATIATPGRRLELTSMMMGPDPELVRAGPLVWAPLPAVIFGAFAARLALVGAMPPFVWTAVFGVLAAALAMRGARRFEAAAPRFSPQAGEMAYAPPPTAGEEGLVIGRGAPGGAIRNRCSAPCVPSHHSGWVQGRVARRFPSGPEAAGRRDRWREARASGS
mgnify:CR=1 FL=1